jgi:hypothetical protein
MTVIAHPIRRINTVTGIAVIALPLLALAVMFVTPGTMLVLVLNLGALLGASYVLLVSMAASGFFGPRAAFSFTERGAIRGRIAAWGNGTSILLTAFFLVDGTDENSWSSPFIAIFGLDRDVVGATSGLLSAILLRLAAAFYFWFFIEWMLALRQRRRVL